MQSFCDTPSDRAAVFVDGLSRMGQCEGPCMFDSTTLSDFADLEGMTSVKDSIDCNACTVVHDLHDCEGLG